MDKVLPLGIVESTARLLLASGAVGATAVRWSRSRLSGEPSRDAGMPCARATPLGASRVGTSARHSATAWPSRISRRRSKVHRRWRSRSAVSGRPQRSRPCRSFPNDIRGDRRTPRWSFCILACPCTGTSAASPGTIWIAGASIRSRPNRATRGLRPIGHCRIPELPRGLRGTADGGRGVHHRPLVSAPIPA